MNILDTGFHLGKFADVSEFVAGRAMRWIHRDALFESRRPHGYACLINDDCALVITLLQRDNGMRAFVVIGAGTVAGAVRRHEAEVVTIARDMGASTLAFRSDRPGWSRLLGPQWSHHGDLFERSV